MNLTLTILTAYVAFTHLVLPLSIHVHYRWLKTCGRPKT